MAVVGPCGREHEGVGWAEAVPEAGRRPTSAACRRTLGFAALSLTYGQQPCFRLWARPSR